MRVKVIDLTGFVESSAVITMLHGNTGICVGCKAEIPAGHSKKVMREDITRNPMRVVCASCANPGGAAPVPLV